MLNIDKIKKIFQKKKYTLSNDKLNIICIRTGEMLADTFNDFIFIVFKKNNKWIIENYNTSLSHRNHIGYIKEGQYIDTFAYDIQYNIIKQIKQLELYKSNNIILDKETNFIIDNNFNISYESSTLNSGIIIQNNNIDFFNVIRENIILKESKNIVLTILELKDLN
jgi:hypothetical protein